MKTTSLLALGCLVAACDGAYANGYSGYAASGTEITQIASSDILTGPDGMTLYTFDRDAAGVSKCYGDCATAWPPYVAASGDAAPAAGFTAIERRDGTLQWAKDGEPLYFWVGDTRPGDVTGDGVGGVWHIAR
ncbi:MAG: hypothetical protein AAFR57_02750 [Pseudomonadota bacterium]